MERTGRTLLIFAFDYSAFEESHREMLVAIAPHIDLIKIGLEAMTAEVPGTRRTVASLVREFVHDILDQDVMWDMKLLDVQNTMEKAAKNIIAFDSKFFTIHAQASDGALKAVAKASAGSASLPLAVTALTDLDNDQCLSRFESFSEDAVLRFARLAKANGVRGIVCSSKEARLIRKEVDPEGALTIITPGIRPTWAVAPDEQKRVTTPRQAIMNGANGIVVGRPISGPPSGMSPAEAAKRIRLEMDGTPPPKKGQFVDKLV